MLTHPSSKSQNLLMSSLVSNMSINHQNRMQSMLSSLKVQDVEDIPLHLKQKRVNENLIDRNYYYRHTIFYQLQQRVLQMNVLEDCKKSLDLSKYFDCRLNSIYKSSQKLPIKIFVCGYCKEPFFQDLTYLRHCIVCQCPLNHERSTFFFYFKNTSTKINIFDVTNTITSNQLYYLMKSHDGKSQIFFLSYELTAKDEKKTPKHFQCRTCKVKYSFSNKKQIATHCFKQCKNFKNGKRTHFIKIQYCDQQFNHFVQDISHFLLNYNILALSSDSYIRITNNHLSQKYKFQLFCDHCKQFFSNSQDLLRHCLFQCNSSFDSSPSSFIKRKLTEKFSDKKQVNCTKNLNNGQDEDSDQGRIQTQGRNQQSKNDYLEKMNTKQKVFEDIIQTYEINQQPDNVYFEKMNIKYEAFEDLLNSIYFCGQCLESFKSRNLYFAHCLVFLCPLNHPNSSHHYLDQRNNQPFKIGQLDSSLLREKNLIAKNKKLQRKIKSRYLIKDKRTKQIQHNQYGFYMFCGNCNKTLKNKRDYILHILRTCKCPNNPNNSHIVELVQRERTEQIYFQHLTSLKFGFQIMRLTSSTKYRLKSKNDYMNDYFCGKCRQKFTNKYEFVYHSIFVCKSQELENSSHQINRVPAHFNDPLDVILDNSYYHEEKRQNHQENKLLIRKKRDNRKGSSSFQSDLKPQCQNQQSQKRENRKYSSSPMSKIAELQHLQQRSIPQNILEQDSQRFLIPNIDFITDHQKKFFCGKCNIFVKRSERLIEHFTECKNFQNTNSSHFYITSNRQHQIIQRTVFKKTDLKFSCKMQFPMYKHKNNSLFACGCGQHLVFRESCLHIFNHHKGEVQEGGSHIILRIQFLNCKDRSFIYLPIQSNNNNPEDFFNCPCNPNKKLNYNDFVRHILIKHGGKSPIFHMRKPMHENQKREIQI